MLLCRSVMQPWASFLIHALKTHETRSWTPKHRGPLLIHASRRLPFSVRELCASHPHLATALGCLKVTRPDDLPRGAIIGTVNITDVLPTESLTTLTPMERALGDYSPGRYAWLCTNPRICTPIATGGRLGFFACPEAAIAQVRESFPDLAELLPVPEKRSA